MLKLEHCFFAFLHKCKNVYISKNNNLISINNIEESVRNKNLSINR